VLSRHDNLTFSDQPSPDGGRKGAAFKLQPSCQVVEKIPKVVTASSGSKTKKPKSYLTKEKLS
jgi:hypothetical protein